MDVLKTIGTSPLGELQYRDAIHVAVVAVKAAETLRPGTHVAIDYVTPRGVVYVKAATKDCIGIIDPFLLKPVSYGISCWLFLYPATVTSIRHDWTHPAFEGVKCADESENRSAATIASAEAEEWLKKFASDMGIPFGRLMDALHDFCDTGGQCILGFDTPSEIYDESLRRQMWKCFATLTGKRPSDVDGWDIPFRCSC